MPLREGHSARLCRLYNFRLRATCRVLRLHHRNTCRTLSAEQLNRVQFETNSPIRSWSRSLAAIWRPWSEKRDYGFRTGRGLVLLHRGFDGLDTHGTVRTRQPSRRTDAPAYSALAGRTSHTLPTGSPKSSATQ